MHANDESECFVAQESREIFLGGFTLDFRSTAVSSSLTHILSLPLCDPLGYLICRGVEGVKANGYPFHALLREGDINIASS